jgi:branched-chain amino acid transport system substrate-binding protein
VATEYQPSYSNSLALIIGINSYTDQRFVPLGEAEHDAQALAEVLAAPPYGFQTTLLMGHSATRQAILQALFQLRSAGQDDRVLVFFAGHGYTIADTFGDEKGFLAAADTAAEQDFTALAMEDVTDLTRYARAKHIAFIFDACYSGQALGLTRSAAISSDKFLMRRAYQIISAGAGDQTVSDYRSMTDKLLEALKGRVLSSDGLMTFSEIGLYLQQSIASESGRTQIPQFGHIRGSQGGDFIFYEEKGARLPITLQTGLSSERSMIRKGVAGALLDLLISSDPEMSALARRHLEQMAHEDPDESVRQAAQDILDSRQAPVLEKPIPRTITEPVPIPSPIPPRDTEPIAPRRDEIAARAKSDQATVQAPARKERPPAASKAPLFWGIGAAVLAVAMLACVLFAVSSMFTVFPRAGNSGPADQANNGLQNATVAPTMPPAGQSPTLVPNACQITPEDCMVIQPGDPIKVAVLAPFSGDSVNWGTDFQRAAEIAAADQGGKIAGHEIEIYPADDAADKDTAIQVSKNLTAIPYLVGVIGPESSGIATEIAPIYEAARVPLISPSASRIDLTTSGYTSFLRTSHSDTDRIDTAISLLVDRLGTSAVAILYEPGEQLAQDAEVANQRFGEHGVKVVVYEQINPGEDYTKQMEWVRDNGAESIFFIGWTEEAASLLVLREKLGIQDKPFIGIDNIRDPYLIELAGSSAEGAWSMYFDPPDTSTTREVFDNAYISNYGDKPGTLSEFTRQTYDAARILLMAVEQVVEEGEGGILYINKQSLLDALHNTSGFEGASGTITCTPQGDCAIGIGTTYQVIGGEWVRQ